MFRWVVRRDKLDMPMCHAANKGVRIDLRGVTLIDARYSVKIKPYNRAVVVAWLKSLHDQTRTN